MELEWLLAPEGTEFYARGKFRRKSSGDSLPEVYNFSRGWIAGVYTLDECVSSLDFRKRPPEWPENDDRISAIAQNGNTGEHYQDSQPKTAAEFLNACAAVQSERGKQYDASGTGERSFAAAASAFNAATGKQLTGSDVCLLLTMVKLVRQYSSPDRLHQDSLLDGVSYLSLWAEMLTKELGEK